MIFRKVYLTIVFGSLLIACQTVAVTQENNRATLTTYPPNWVQNKPVSAIYYYGIGNADLANPDYQLLAKEEAIADIASEISVTISSNSLLHQFENDLGLRETYRNNIQARTSKEIEGHEQEDNWSGPKQYWTLYRLSKTEYNNRKKQKKEQALSKGLEAYQLAMQQLKTSPASAFSNLCRCLSSIEDYLNVDTYVSINDSSINLAGQCYKEIEYLVTQLNIDVPTQVTRPKRNESPLFVKAVFNANKTPFINLPVSINDGYNEIQKVVPSNGVLQLSPSELDVTSKLITIEPEFKDLNSTESVFIHKLINSLQAPLVEVRIVTPTIRLYLESEEYNLGIQRKESITATHLKNALTALGYDFVNDQISADVRIKLKAYTRKGTEISGLYTTYLDMEVSAFDDSNKEIYAKSVASVKGINLDYKKAGLKALNDSEDRIRTEVAQDIIKHF